VVDPSGSTWWVVADLSAAWAFAPALPGPLELLVTIFGRWEIAAFDQHGERRTVRLPRGHDVELAVAEVAELLRRGERLPSRLNDPS
jgi:hypothetical protein